MLDSTSQKLIALIGTPNSGKTTLYNWLTGSKFRTVNYPGSTVEYSLGKTHSRFGQPHLVMDTPGTYSLFPKSPDEEVTCKAIYRHQELGPAQVVIAVVDATQMERHLYLVRQAQESGFRVIVALTMVDLVAKEGLEIDISQLKTELNCPIVRINGLIGGGAKELVELLHKEEEKTSEKITPQTLKPWDAAKREQVIHDLKKISHQVIKPIVNKTKDKSIFEKTREIDKVLLHPIAGLFLFAGIMALLFTSIFWMAQPLMDWVDTFFSDTAATVHQLGPGSIWASFLSDGVITSFGAVLVFVPQIFILFIGISILESSGYLARAATLIDRPFAKIGMNGRSFVPIISAYACAVPAMMATRTIGSKRERWITMFILPFMTCSARIPVYALLLSFLFFGQPAWKPGVALAVIYFGSLIVGAIAASILNKILASETKSPFMLELPLYRTPQWRVVFKTAISRTKSYIRRAGPVIFVLALIIWIGTSFPNFDAESETERLQSSYAGQAGQVIQPIFEPLGVDWRVGVGLISAFAAREVFVSSLAVLFNVAGDDDQSLRSSLLTSMKEARFPETGAPIFTTSTIIGLVVFFMLALQCIATTAMAQREMNSWKFAITQLVAMNILAYVVATLTVQGLRALGVS